jgi:hypothetical protein
MNQAPIPDPEATPEAARRGLLANRIVVIALVLVGVLGTLAMLNELYGSKATPPHSSREDLAATPRPASSGAPGEGRLVLRLQAFSDVATAEDLRAKLEALKIPASISVEARVQAGPFKTQEEANAARAKLKELGIYGGELVTTK